LLPLFDKIYFFKRGKIIASGNYKELKKSSAAFRKLLEKYQKATK
jgi:ABC-type multidrug transport system ATPase subunit